MAKTFVQQTVRGNQVIAANPDDINHTLLVNRSISTIKDKINGTYERVRGNTSVQRKFGVDTDCTDCKRKLDASFRVEWSIPQGLSVADRLAFIATVAVPATENALARLRGGETVGFAVNTDTSVGA